MNRDDIKLLNEAYNQTKIVPLIDLLDILKDIHRSEWGNSPVIVNSLKAAVKNGEKIPTTIETRMENDLYEQVYGTPRPDYNLDESYNNQYTIIYAYYEIYNDSNGKIAILDSEQTSSIIPEEIINTLKEYAKEYTENPFEEWNNVPTQSDKETFDIILANLGIDVDSNLIVSAGFVGVDELSWNAFVLKGIHNIPNKGWDSYHYIETDLNNLQ